MVYDPAVLVRVELCALFARFVRGHGVPVREAMVVQQRRLEEVAAQQVGRPAGWPRTQGPACTNVHTAYLCMQCAAQPPFTQLCTLALLGPASRASKKARGAYPRLTPASVT